MRWPARNIWDTRIQCVCGVLTTHGEAGVEVYISGNFGQVSLSPSRVAINPNRLYPIEPAIRTTRRFAINVMSVGHRDQVIGLINLRRREPRKVEVLGMKIDQDDHKIPFLPGSLRTIFCEVETIRDTGDHTLIIAKVLESRANPLFAGQRPLLYPEVAGTPSRFPALRKLLRALLATTGASDVIKTFLERRRMYLPSSIAQTTYQEGGQTEAEIATVSKFGLLDHSRHLCPPGAPAIVKKKLGICVVGTEWGSFHCRLVRRASPAARLFVCGRNPEKTARLARVMGADDFFIGLEQAVADPRVQALTLALPHDLHRQAVEMAAAAGKHALVEKPIATNLSDADAMIDAARRARTILMVAEDMHFRPAVREAVRRIACGDIGEPLYLLAHGGGVRRPQGWAADKDRMGGGVFLDIGVHYVHALRLLLGEPESVFASSAMQINTKISGEDSIQVLFSSSTGWEAHMLLTWSSQRGQLPDIVVMGDKGTLHLWPGARFLDYYPVAPLPLTRMIACVRPYWLQETLMGLNRQRVRVVLPDRDRTGYVAEVREFLAAVAEERLPSSLPEDARRDLEIVLCGYKARGCGVRVQIMPLGSRPTN